MSGIPIEWAELEAVYARTLGRGLRSLAVTAAGPGEGVTTLARALAERAAAVGVRTLYVDFNLRNPMVPGGSGAFLAEDVAVENAVLPTLVDALHVMPAPTRAANPLALRDSARLRAALDNLLAEYAFIVFDTSPLNVTNGGNIPAEAVAAACDGVVLVVLAERTTAGAAGAATARLRRAGAQVIGVVMNDRFAPTLADELCREIGRFDRLAPGLVRRVQGWIKRKAFLGLRP